MSLPTWSAYYFCLSDISEMLAPGNSLYFLRQSPDLSACDDVVFVGVFWNTLQSDPLSLQYQGF